MDKKVLNENELKQVAGGVGPGTVVSSGSFASNSGTSVNLLVNWTVQSDGYGARNLYVDVSATSYALYSRSVGIDLTANGVLYSASSAPVSYGGTAQTTNHLASFVVPNVSGPVNLSVAWHFNGTLSGVPVGDIRAVGVANT